MSSNLLGRCSRTKSTLSIGPHNSTKTLGTVRNYRKSEWFIDWKLHQWSFESTMCLKEKCSNHLISNQADFMFRNTKKKSVSFINTEGTKASLHQPRKNQKLFEDKKKYKIESTLLFYQLLKCPCYQIQLKDANSFMPVFLDHFPSMILEFCV